MSEQPSTTQTRRSRHRRLVFDALGLTNIAAIIASDLAQFPDAGTGFKVYTGIVTLLATTTWLLLRRYEHPIWLTALLQLTLLGHITGRTVTLEGVQLYKTVLLGIPTDKTIHALNSMTGAAYVTVLFRREGPPLGTWETFTVVMVTTGLGAFIEIVEYLGVLLLPVTFVGGYENNAQDLIANLFGAVVGWFVVRLWAPPKRL